jgi:hypothetical protein
MNGLKVENNILEPVEWIGYIPSSRDGGMNPI